MNKKLILGLLVMGTILLVWSLNRSNDDAVLKIGYLGPFTGPAAASSGTDVANGFKLAASERFQIGTKRVEVIYEDDGCDPAKAVSAARKLLDTDKVNVLVSGVCSGSTLAVAPIAESRQVILFTPVSESPKITTAGDYVFRTSASSLVSADAIVEGLDRLGYSQIAVLFENAEYTAGMKEAFVQKFTANGKNKILATESFGSKDTDVRTQVIKLNQTKPQALVFIVNSAITANLAIDQARDLKVTLPVIGNAYYGFTQALNNPNTEGMYVAVYEYDQNAPAVERVLTAYKTKFGLSASQDVYAALAYDGYNVLFRALEECGEDNTGCLKKALYNTKNYSGITGSITIDQNGDTERKFILKQVQVGRLVK